MRRGFFSGFIITIVVAMIIFLKHKGHKVEEKHEENAYGRDFNSERISRGIPIIEENWINHEKDSLSFFWSNSKNELLTSKPHHFYKIVEIEDGKIVSEIDAFNFGMTPDTAYRVIFNYCFSCKEKWKTQLLTYFPNRYPALQADSIEFIKADSIIRSWGLKREN